MDVEYNKKLRGQQHRTNKKRYSNKTKANTSSNSKESVENKTLDNNWDRYESLTNAEEVIGTNFSHFANAPVSVGGYFQFKSDKNIESEFDFGSLRNSKLFSLDLNQLQYGLMSIPFHERCGLSTDYFTQKELDENNLKAQNNDVGYKNYLRIRSITESLNLNASGSREKQPVEQSDKKGSCVVPSRIQNDQLHDNLDDVLCDELEVASHKRDVKNKDELEQWLDDILDD